MGAKKHAKNIQKHQNTTKALELRSQGLTYRAIGDQLGVTYQSAFRYVKEALAELKEKNQNIAEDLRALLGERIELSYKALWPKVESGDPQAIAVWLKAIELHARLFGLLEAPPQAVQSNIIIQWAHELPQPEPETVISAAQRLEVFANG